LGTTGVKKHGEWEKEYEERKKECKTRRLTLSVLNVQNAGRRKYSI
jgi:hypothetical protein